MSSATPMVSSVLDVLLKTSAPTGRGDPTAALACSPEAASRHVMPLRSRARAVAWMRLSEASWANSAMASGVGPTLSRSLGTLLAEGALMSVATDFGESLMDQRHGHGALADRRRAPFDRPAAHVAGGEQPGLVGFEGQGRTRERPPDACAGLGGHVGSGPEVAGLVDRQPESSGSVGPRDAADADEERVHRQAGG